MISRCILLSLCVLGLIASEAAAQWAVPRYTISNTGVWSSGGSYRLLATTGQTVVGQVRWADHGFWPTVSASVTIVDREEAAEVPQGFRLRGNYPNPFNPTTTLRFDLPEAAEVRVDVFDLLGRSVLTLAPGQMPAGTGHTLPLDASALTSGMYLYRLRASGAAGFHTATGRLVLLK